jgi:alkylation response protein AidB-like acyl-CoA dehydrogenase
MTTATPLRDVVLATIEAARADAASARLATDVAVSADLHEAAVQAGIAARVLDDAVWWVRERARPIKHSSATRSLDDPYIRRTVGEIALRAQAARAVVLLAADTVADEGPGAGNHVALARVAATESALAAGVLLFDVGGGSITDRSLGLDRHWREARTADTDARPWTLAEAGLHHLTGPPAIPDPEKVET